MIAAEDLHIFALPQMASTAYYVSAARGELYYGSVSLAQYIRAGSVFYKSLSEPFSIRTTIC